MLIRCKKILSFLLSFCLLFSLSVSAYAETDSRILSRIEGCGLMEGYADGGFGEEDELTRGQICMIAARILQVDGMGYGSSPFTDVADDHWAKDAIAALSQFGVVNGMGDGTFMPDRSVSYFEAAKILVSVLGYEKYAEKLGTYPNGYLAQASKLGLLKGIMAKEEAATRGDVARMLYNALDVKPIGYSFMQNYPDLTYTLQQILENIKDLVQFRGILQETPQSSLLAVKPSIDKGYVIIGGKKLLCDMPMEEHLGSEVIVYAYLDDSLNQYRIKSFNVTGQTAAYEAEAANVIWNGDTAEIFDEHGESLKKLTMAGAVQTLYNGRLATVSATNRKIHYGSYRFVDANDDNRIDVLFINEAQSFIIDKISPNNHTIYFKNRVTLNGRRAIVLDQDDEDKTVVITNTKGEPLSFENIEKNSGVTMFVSQDWNYVKAVITTEQVEGKITEIAADEVSLDGTQYKLAKKPDGTANCIPTINEQGVYVLDALGSIIDCLSAIQSDYQYGYVIAAKRANGISDAISLQIVSGLEPQKDVKVSGGDETISYYFQNDTVKVYECSDKVAVYLEGHNEKENLSTLDVNNLSRCMAAYRLNGDGKIRELHVYDVSMAPFANHTFNAKALTFGGEGLIRGYATDENTKFVCIPASGSTNTSDYYVQVKCQDEDAACRVYGTVFFPEPGYADPNAEPVDVLLIKADMNVASAPVPGSTEDICIVGEVTTVLGTVHDDVGANVYKIKLLNDKTVHTLTTASSGEAYEMAKTLRRGDLIRYVKDGFGRISGIKKICSVQGMGEDYTANVILSSGSETAMYGLIYDVILDTYDHTENDYVDKFVLSFAPDGGDSEVSNELRVPKEDSPPVYHYDRRSGWIKAGSLEDVTASSYAGSDASKAYVLLSANEVAAVVIIEN